MNRSEGQYSAHLPSGLHQLVGECTIRVSRSLNAEDTTYCRYSNLILTRKSGYRWNTTNRVKVLVSVLVQLIQGGIQRELPIVILR